MFDESGSKFAASNRAGVLFEYDVEYLLSAKTTDKEVANPLTTRTTSSKTYQHATIYCDWSNLIASGTNTGEVAMWDMRNR